MLSVAAWSVAVQLVVWLAERFFPRHPLPTGTRLTVAWQQWDANWYERIVLGGYHSMPDAIPGHGSMFLQAAFYPVFPVISRAVYELLHPFGPGASTAMLLTNQALVFLLAWFFYRMAVSLTGDTAIALRSVRYLLLFPFAYFLLAPYSETAFITFLAGFCWALSTRRYLLAGAVGAAASATRSVGVVLPLILIVGFLEQHDWNWRAIRPRTVLAALLPFTGVGAYTLYQWLSLGSPTYAQRAEKYGWARSLTLNLWKVIRDSFHNPPLSAGYIGHAPFEAYVIFPLLGASVLLSVVAWRRLGAAMGLLCGLLILLPMASGTLTSFNRYVLPLLPCFIVLGIWGRSAIFDFVYRTLGSVLLTLFLIMFVHGLWTG